MPLSRRARANTSKAAGTAAGAVLGGGAGAVGAGLLTKGAAAGSGLLAAGGFPAAATATSGLTTALIATAPVALPLVGVLVGGLAAYAIMKNVIEA